MGLAEREGGGEGVARGVPEEEAVTVGEEVCDGVAVAKREGRTVLVCVGLGLAERVVVSVELTEEEADTESEGEVVGVGLLEGVAVALPPQAATPPPCPGPLAVEESVGDAVALEDTDSEVLCVDVVQAETVAEPEKEEVKV